MTFFKRTRFLWIAVVLLVFIGLFYPTPTPQPIRYVERSTRQIKTETVVGENWLHWLYENPLGKASLEILVKRKFLSALYGYWMDRPSSVSKIRPFIKKYHIDTTEFTTSQFSSFNDFFTRHLKPATRPIDTNPRTVVSPADGKLLAYQNLSNRDFIVKGYRFDVFQFLHDSALAQQYKNGSMIIIRLCPTDYHRFHFPVEGTVLKQVDINGAYYSVSPIALHRLTDIFLLNKRCYTTLKTKLFGTVVIAEVGATMVGSIVQTYQTHTVKKGQEKGFFKFGGSTVILLFKPNTIRIDNDLLQNTKNHLETEVKMGSHIATVIN